MNVNAAKQFINRETSWLAFNQRVLEQAADIRTPLLERLRFLGIFTTNLDEFVMKRLGGLKWQKLSTETPLSVDGLTPQEQLFLIRQSLLPLLDRQAAIFRNSIVPELKLNGVEFVSISELDSAEQEWGYNYFKQYIFPVLTPVAVDAEHPFPFITNLSLSLGVALKAPDEGKLKFARVKVSGKLPSLVQLPSLKKRFISVSAIVENYLTEIFPGMEVCGSMLFRITRNAGLELQAEEEAADLLELVEEELRQRRYARAVRMEHGVNYNPWIRDFIMNALHIGENDVYTLKGELDYSIFKVIYDLPLPQLKYERYHATVPHEFVNAESIFSVIRKQNVLVHHPYQSFAESVEKFVREAADDDAVRSIKMTVYRVGDETPLLPLLIRAASHGKEVICLVELMARFDEERNMQFAQALEDAGVNIVYGRPGVKIHAKTLLVVREEDNGLRCYAHIGTGNYNIKTASIYTDLGFFTSDSSYTKDTLDLFNFLTGHSKKEDYRKLLISPFNMEKHFLDLIDIEIWHARNGRNAHIILKMNALEDIHVIAKLYEAAQAGVKIDLIVRGICCLRPNTISASSNIRIRSIIGRYLEHSRIYYFSNGEADPLAGHIFISSADWMTRNFHKRIEIAVPLENSTEKEKCWKILQLMLNDNVLAWQMDGEGCYFKNKNANMECISTHDALMQEY